MLKTLSSLVNRFKKSEEIKDLEEIVFIEIDAKNMPKEHPQALIDLYKSQKHGFLIKHFLSPEELDAIQRYALNNKDRDIATTGVGFTYPMVFQEFSLRNKDLSKEELAVAWEKYFTGNEYYNTHFKEETGIDLQKKFNDFFESISGGKKVQVAKGMNNKGSYLFGNFRK